MPIAEAQLREIVADIWSVMLGVTLTPGGPGGPGGPGAREMPGASGAPGADRGLDDGARVVTGCVHITGAWDGAVTVELPAELAGEACARMVGLDGEACSVEDVHDTVGELANMTGGGVKGALGDGSSLSLPSVTEGADYEVVVPGGRPVAEATFDHDGRPVRVTVYERMERHDPAVGRAG